MIRLLTEAKSTIKVHCEVAANRRNVKIMTESSSIQVFAERLRPSQRRRHRKVASRPRRGCAAPSADGVLMERLSQRDTSALEVLHGRYARPVYSLVLRILQEPASAEEIVQDVFLLLWRNAVRYRVSRGPLEPWLFTLARNRALDYLRLRREKQRRREDSYDFDLAGSGAEPNPEALIDGARRAECVRICLGELPEWQRRSIELAFFGGMTHSEIAVALAEPLGTVKNWIRNGLIRLREALGGDPSQGRASCKQESRSLAIGGRPLAARGPRLPKNLPPRCPQAADSIGVGWGGDSAHKQIFLGRPFSAPLSLNCYERATRKSATR